MFAFIVFGQTAYVNGQRQGFILEKPFCLGDTITKGIGSSYFSAHQNTVLDIEAEIKLAFDSFFCLSLLSVNKTYLTRTRGVLYLSSRTNVLSIPRLGRAGGAD